MIIPSKTRATPHQMLLIMIEPIKTIFYYWSIKNNNNKKINSISCKSLSPKLFLLFYTYFIRELNIFLPNQTLNIPTCVLRLWLLIVVTSDPFVTVMCFSSPVFPLRMITALSLNIQADLQGTRHGCTRLPYPSTTIKTHFVVHKTVITILNYV